MAKVFIISMAAIGTETFFFIAIIRAASILFVPEVLSTSSEDVRVE